MSNFFDACIQRKSYNGICNLWQKELENVSVKLGKKKTINFSYMWVCHVVSDSIVKLYAERAAIIIMLIVIIYIIISKRGIKMYNVFVI